jgi:putative colanic acid biosynthesis glycosyltransferase
MKNKTYFVVVTIVRNDFAGLVKTKNSLFRQTFSDFTWVIIDGASTDGGAEYVLSLKQERVIVVSEPDGGIYDAMNKGLKLAEGEYVVFMNAGDCFANDENLDIIFRLGQGFDFVYGDSLEDVNGDVKYKKSRGIENLKKGMFGCHQSMYYRVSIAKKIGFSSCYKIAGDYDFTARFLLSSKKYFKVDGPLAIFDMSGVSNLNDSLGRAENWRIQRDVLEVSIVRRVLLRVDYVLASFLRKRMNYIYSWLRYSNV